MDALGTVETTEGAAPADDAAQRTFLTRLAAAGEMLTSGTPAESPIAAIARAWLVLTEADHAAVFLRSPAGVVTCPWSHNLSDEYVGELVTPSGVNPWIHILRHPELTCMDLPKTRRRTEPAPWFLPDVLELSSDHAALVDRSARENFRSMCVWPLGRDGRVIAALACYYDVPHECSVEEQTSMRAFAAQATAVLDEGIAHSTGVRATIDAARGQTPPAVPAAGRRSDAHPPRSTHVGAAPADRPAAPAQSRTGFYEPGGRSAAAQQARAGERERFAAAWQEVKAAQARVREARAEIAAEQQRLADMRRGVEDERTRLTEAQRDHAAERNRVADARRQLEADQARLAEARAALEAERARHEGDGKHLAAARLEAANEETRVSETRNLLREESVRLEALRQDLEAQQARLAGDRASLDADVRRLADSQAAVAAETDRLADMRRELEAAAARLTAERQVLDAERARPAPTQVKPVSSDTAPAKNRRSVRTDEKQAGPVLGVDAAPPQPPETAAATTYAVLVERAGAANVANEDDRIAAVARHLDARNGHAAGYSKRLAEWAEALARALRCADQVILSTRRAALLHDIGKIDVPEATLKKAAGLTDDERTMVENEPAVAHQILKDVKGLGDAATILRHRFERWNGGGRPDGLKEDAIPLGARILSVVDAYGEMTAGRPGVPKLYYRDAITALQRESGARFDPKITSSFCRIVKQG